MNDVTLVGPELVSLVGALFLPWLIGLVKSQRWSETVRLVVAYLSAFGWTALSFWLTEQIVFDSTSGIKHIILTSFAVALVSHAAFKLYYQDKETL
jgi:cyanate permease